MLFGCFWSQDAGIAPKVLISVRLFYGSFSDSPASTENIVLLMVFNVLRCRGAVSIYSETQCFLVLFEAKTRKGLRKYELTTGFYKGLSMENPPCEFH